MFCSSKTYTFYEVQATNSCCTQLASFCCSVFILENWLGYRIPKQPQSWFDQKKQIPSIAPLTIMESDPLMTVDWLFHSSFGHLRESYWFLSVQSCLLRMMSSEHTHSMILTAILPNQWNGHILHQEFLVTHLKSDLELLLLSWIQFASNNPLSSKTWGSFYVTQILLYISKQHSIMALKCKLLYPVAVQSYHEIINYITLQALSAKMGNINSGLSLEVTSLWVVWIFGFGLVLSCFCCYCLINLFLSVFKARIFKRNYFSWTVKGIWEPVSYLLWKAQPVFPSPVLNHPNFCV